MGLLNSLFGIKSKRIHSYLKEEAVMLDVRTLKEYNVDHVKGAVHIPITELKSRIEEVKQLNKPIIAYCRSGVRSAQATSILKANGIDAINGGGIAKVKSILQQ